MSSEDYLSILASHNNRGKLKFDRSFDCTQSWFFQVLDLESLLTSIAILGLIGL